MAAPTASRFGDVSARSDVVRPNAMKFRPPTLLRQSAAIRRPAVMPEQPPPPSDRHDHIVVGDRHRKDPDPVGPFSSAAPGQILTPKLRAFSRAGSQYDRPVPGRIPTRARGRAPSCPAVPRGSRPGHPTPTTPPHLPARQAGALVRAAVGDGRQPTARVEHRDVAPVHAHAPRGARRKVGQRADDVIGQAWLSSQPEHLHRVVAQDHRMRVVAARCG
jgi:hypothetical protein